jgi:putative addiction module component (TIGR02574 family)
MDVDQLLQEVLRLPLEARAKLLGELIHSLDESQPDADRDVAWAVEIQRRIQTYDAGKARVVSGDELLDDLKAIASGGST